MILSFIHVACSTLIKNVTSWDFSVTTYWSESTRTELTLHSCGWLISVDKHYSKV